MIYVHYFIKACLFKRSRHELCFSMKPTAFCSTCTKNTSCILAESCIRHIFFEFPPCQVFKSAWSIVPRSLQNPPSLQFIAALNWKRWALCFSSALMKDRIICMYGLAWDIFIILWKFNVDINCFLVDWLKITM